jgi:transcriptional regulator with XRE-family HTH domain
MPGVTKPTATDRKAFSRRLLAAMDRTGTTREDLATALGVSYGTIGNWLRGTTDCPVGWVPRMASALGVPIQELMVDPGPTPEDALAKRVVEVLERPLSARDLMGLLAEARDRLR